MTTAPSPTLTVRSVPDLLAVAPAVLGFWPRESVVMLTLGARRPFHARLDLPPLSAHGHPRALQRELEDLLIAPAVRHGVAAVVLLYFTAQPAAAEATHALLARACRRAGLPVPVAAATDGESYVELDPAGGPAPPVPYDAAAHPLIVEAVAAGRLVHGGREALEASLEQDPDAVAGVLDALVSAGHLDAGPPAGARAVRAQGTWVARTVAHGVAGGEPPGPTTVARLVWAMQVPRIRDAAWSLLDRSTAAGHVRFWTAVLRAAPDSLAAAPATLLGWSAWQAGDGALAWIALDRCREVDPDYPIAGLLAMRLRHAVPPEAWTGGFDWALGLPPVTEVPD